MDRFWEQRLLYILEMPEGRVKTAKKVLQALSIAAGPLDFDAFCECIAIELDQTNRSCVLSDPKDLLDLCPDLIEFSTVEVDGPHCEKWPNLVHPSIREYLFSKRIDSMTGLVSEFSMTEDKANSDMAKTCLTYLLQFKGDTLRVGNLVEKYSFLPYAAALWNIHVKQIKSSLSPSLERLIIELFTSEQDVFQTWLQAYDPDTEKEYSADKTLFPSPLYYASLLGYPSQVQVLLNRGAKTNESRGKHRYPLLAAIENGHLDVARLAIHHGADIEARYKNKDPALVRAVQKGHSEITALLIGSGANVNAPDKQGKTALHCAVTYVRQDSEPYEHILRLLLQAGAGTDLKDMHGRTPLHSAVMYDREQMTQLLLDAGADVEATDKDDKTPLHHAAVFFEPGMRCLLAKGANIECRDHHGFTPLLEAVARGFETGTRLLLEQNADVHGRDEKGWTALHFASANGFENLVPLLLEHRSKIEDKTSREETALHLAVRNQHEPVVRVLLEHKISIDVKDLHCRTALHLAAESGDYSESDYEERILDKKFVNGLRIATLLLENGADTDVKDDEGMTPIRLALASGHEAMAEVFHRQKSQDL